MHARTHTDFSTPPKHERYMRPTNQTRNSLASNMNIHWELWQSSMAYLGWICDEASTLLQWRRRKIETLGVPTPQANWISCARSTLSTITPSDPHCRKPESLQSSAIKRYQETWMITRGGGNKKKNITRKTQCVKQTTMATPTNQLPDMLRGSLLCASRLFLRGWDGTMAHLSRSE